MVFDGRLEPTWATARELKGCAVTVLKQHPEERSETELAELVKAYLVRRRLRWRYSLQITEALRRAGRYDGTGRCQE